MSDTTTITLKREVKELLEEDKPDDATWNTYLRALAEDTEHISERDELLVEISSKMKDIQLDMDSVPHRAADEVEDRLRGGR